MTTTEDRLATLEARLQRVEDEQAIGRLVASYGPLVDAGEDDRVAALWAEDGSYSVEGWEMNSRADVAAMVRSNAHQGLIGKGSCHFLGPAHVTLSEQGDTAVAVCESVLLARHKDRPVIARMGANLFELARSADGWQITRRTTRGLDGSRESHDLLAGRIPD